MTLQEQYGTVVAGPVLSQAWPELDDPCWLCGHETQGTYVVWGLSSGELVHICDECQGEAPRAEEAE